MRKNIALQIENEKYEFVVEKLHVSRFFTESQRSQHLALENLVLAAASAESKKKIQQADQEGDWGLALLLGGKILEGLGLEREVKKLSN